MKIHMLEHFDPVAHGFDAEFTLDLEWFDARLKYRNLKSKPNINSLSLEEVATIWFPNFVFDNTAKKDMGLTKFERLEKKNTELLEKIYISKTIFTKMTKIMERISFKLKLTKGSNVGSTKSLSGF